MEMFPFIVGAVAKTCVSQMWMIDDEVLLVNLMGAEVSPSSHHCFGGLMYMHHSSQLYPWPEFS